MNESQLKSFVRQAFALQDTSDRAVLDVDALLGRVMLEVKRLILAGLPDEGLLRQRAWREMRPLVLRSMVPYAIKLRMAVYREETIAAPDMAAYAAREAKYAGAKLTVNIDAPSAAFMSAAVDRTKIGKRRFRELFVPKQGPAPPWVEGMFRVVDRKVQTGVLQGLTTQQIAQQVVKETKRLGVFGVSLDGDTAARAIRAQAMAMTRTVTQDVQRQVKEQVWDANADALDGFVYQWSAALDSRTCQTCAPLDGKRWNKRSDAPKPPIHVNCRCQLLLIDPEDEFWNEDRKNGQQLKPMYEPVYDKDGKPVLMKNGKPKMRKTDPFKIDGAYQTPIKVKGERFWRRSAPFTGNDYSDYLASSNLTTQREFFGGGPIGERRARYFRRQLDRFNKDPQQVLESMLTGPTTARRFIPLP